MRHQQPAMFALLCDELTQAVAAGRLSHPLREWLKLSAVDQLEGFLDDFVDNPPDVKVCNKSFVCVCVCVCMCVCVHVRLCAHIQRVWLRPWYICCSKLFDTLLGHNGEPSLTHWPMV